MARIEKDFFFWDASVILRVVEEADVPSMAAIRALEWGTETFWADRISRYLSGQHSPQQALPARTAFVAIDGSDLVGFIAGHKTRWRISARRTYRLIFHRAIGANNSL